MADANKSSSATDSTAAGAASHETAELEKHLGMELLFSLERSERALGRVDSDVEDEEEELTARRAMPCELMLRPNAATGARPRASRIAVRICPVSEDDILALRRAWGKPFMT